MAPVAQNNFERDEFPKLLYWVFSGTLSTGAGAVLCPQPSRGSSHSTAACVQLPPSFPGPRLQCISCGFLPCCVLVYQFDVKYQPSSALTGSVRCLQMWISRCWCQCHLQGWPEWVALATVGSLNIPWPLLDKGVNPWNYILSEFMWM